MPNRLLAALLASALLVAPVQSYAQGGPSPGGSDPAASAQAAPPAPPASANETPPAPPPPAAPAPPAQVRLAEGTPIRFTLDEPLSSATAADGDEFDITTSDPVDLGNGVILPAGFRGKGEVTNVEHKGMLGKAGQLTVRLDYVKFGDTRVRLRSSQNHEGGSNQGSAIVLSLLITPLFLLMKGKDAKIPKGQAIVGYVDDDVTVAMPVSPPPQY